MRPAASHIQALRNIRQKTILFREEDTAHHTTNTFGDKINFYLKLWVFWMKLGGEQSIAGTTTSVSGWVGVKLPTYGFGSS